MILKTFSSKTNKATCAAGGQIVWWFGGSMSADTAMSKMIAKTCPFVLGSKKRQKDRFWETIRRQDKL